MRWLALAPARIKQPFRSLTRYRTRRLWLSPLRLPSVSKKTHLQLRVRTRLEPCRCLPSWLFAAHEREVLLWSALTDVNKVALLGQEDFLKFNVPRFEREELVVASEAHVLARAVPHAPLPDDCCTRLGKLVAEYFDAEVAWV